VERSIIARKLGIRNEELGMPPALSLERRREGEQGQMGLLTHSNFEF
jgi:hypothetical protein